MQRLLTTAISRAEIILGHFVAILLITLLQFALLIGFGELLGVGYLREPLAVAVLSVAVAVWTASLGLLVGVLAKTEEQVAMYALIPMFVFSALGGAWMPLEVTGETFQRIAHLTPTAWAMDGYKDIVIRGLGIEAVLLPAGIILGYAVLFFSLALWRFRFE
jgi:ABC-2 type transport system permease protein